MASIAEPDTNGVYSAWNAALCTFRTAFAPTSASLPQPIPTATAVNVPIGLFFDADREHFGSRRSRPLRYVASEQSETVLVRDPRGIPIFVEQGGELG